MSKGIDNKKPESKESIAKMRILGKKTSLIANIIAVMFSLLFFYTSGFGLISSEIHRGGYLLFTMLLCFILYPISKKSAKNKIPLLDWILCLLTIVAVAYWIIEYPSYVYRIGNPNHIDIFVGIILMVLCFEMGRRVIGLILPVLALLFLLYAYFGRYVPGMLAHSGVPVNRIVEFLACGKGGILGIVDNTYATFIFPFIIFAAMLQEAGAGSAIKDFAVSIAGASRGGPAKIAVVASGIIGSVTGSSAANVVITGAYTIPLMKKVGYKPHVAAGIEAAASTGGQMLPPIMGAGAFLLAAFTKTSYIDIIKISFIPAILYFLGVGTMVHFIAGREKMKGLPKEELPKLKTVIIKKGYLFLPLVMILVFLIIGYSPQVCAFIATIFTILLSYVKKETRMTPRKLLNGLILGAKNSLIIGATTGVVGIIIGVTTMTGLGIKFSALILSFSGGILPLAIILTIIAAYILGMGLTVTAAYIVLSVLAAPALMEFGLPMVMAHLIVFWFTQSSQVTPPVALAAFAASGVARCDPNKAGFSAIRSAAPLFIVPFLFVYTPLLLNGPLVEVIETIVSCAIGFVTFAGMMQGYWLKKANFLERVLLGFASVCLFIPTIFSDILGIVVIAGVTIMNRRKAEEMS